MPALNRTEHYVLLGFVREYILSNGYAPCIREMMEGTGCTAKNTVASRLRKLQDAGYLRVTPHVDRGIALTEFGRTLLPWKVNERE